MYEYEERKDKSSIKGVIIQILLMVIFIFILIWLFPTKSDLDKLKPTESISSLKPLYDRIFNENIIAMKDSAKSYYTTPRLPKNVGDSVSMTLGEMLDKKIILPFTDSEGKQCDLEESYVKVTKEDEEFVMKVNLKCSNQENYLLVIMGCYDYCENGICEKNEEDVKNPVINPSRPTTIITDGVIRPIINNNITINNNYCVNENCTPGAMKYYCQYVNGSYYGKTGDKVDKATYEKECNLEEKYYCKYINGVYYGKEGNTVSKETYEKECGEPEPTYICKYVNGVYYGKNGTSVTKEVYDQECGTVIPTYTCKYVNGVYYGKNGNVVTESVYKKECGEPEPTYICKYVNGVYYGSDGRVVSQSTYIAECTTPAPTYKCQYVNGVYYGKNGNVVTQETYIAECTTPTPTYKCQYVNGVYYGKNGNVVTQATYIAECTTPTPTYQCKYMKTTAASYSNWSGWSDWSETRETASNLKQERYKTVTQQRQENQLIGYKNVTYKDPNKPVYGQKQVLIGTRTQTECAEYGYVITSTGSVSTNVTYGAWTSAGLVKLYSTPTNTSTVRYTKVSVGTETCGDCGAKLYTIYKKETRTVSKTSTGASESSTYKCLRTSSYEVPVYGTQNVIIDYDTSTKVEPVYGLVTVERQVTLYSYRTRSVINGRVDYQISNCNNSSLLNNGYQIIDKWEV